MSDKLKLFEFCVNISDLYALSIVLSLSRASWFHELLFRLSYMRYQIYISLYAVKSSLRMSQLFYWPFVIHNFMG